MLRNLHHFLQDESAASAIEYGLIIGMIAAVLVVVLGLLGTGTGDLFTSVCSKLPDSPC